MPINQYFALHPPGSESETDKNHSTASQGNSNITSPIRKSPAPGISQTAGGGNGMPQNRPGSKSPTASARRIK